MLGASPVAATAEERTRALALGGASALSILLTDLPLAVATAPDDKLVVERLHETAVAALAASSSREPLLAAVGQRLTTAIATGFQSCVRDENAKVPARWPALLPALAGTGVLEDASAGCPRVAEILRDDHPSLPVAREVAAALEEVLASGETKAIGPLTQASVPLPTILPRRRHPARSHRKLAIAIVLAALVAGVLALVRFTRARDA
jgi:hypothetical protein